MVKKVEQRLDVSERGKYLINAAKVLRRRKQELGEIITMEQANLPTLFTDHES